MAHVHLALIGYRGSGKTTLGTQLATALSVPFVDSDDAALASLGHDSVRAAWDALGEDAWRAAEASVIPALLKEAGVVALGGGAPMLETVQEALGGVPVIWLRADADVLAQRIASDAEDDDRPSLSGADAAEEVEVMLAARQETYERLATAAVNTAGTIDEAMASLKAAVMRVI